MMRILITGSNGLLGSNLARFFSAKNDHEVFATSCHSSYSSELKNFVRGDLLEAGFAEQLLSTVKPEIIVNTVGLANLDNCEEEPRLAYSIIVQTAENLARFAQRHRIRLIHISTDHLFDGTGSMYSEDDPPAPVNVYGKMKLEAEERILAAHDNAVIVRTNFYGWSPEHHPPTFSEWVFNSLKEQTTITLFTDYYFTPMEVTHLAEALEVVAKSDFRGVLNIAGSEWCSKYDFGIALAEIFNFSPAPIRHGKIAEVTFKARRQQDLSLSTEKFKGIFGRELPNLRDGLQRFCENKKAEPR